MTIEEFKKLKINDMIYWYSEDDFTTYEYKITSIDRKYRGIYIKQDVYEEYISKQECKYYYKDKNKCIVEHLKHMFDYHNICISDIELSIKNLNKEKEQYLKDIQNLKMEYADLIEKNIEEFI